MKGPGGPKSMEIQMSKYLPNDTISVATIHILMESIIISHQLLRIKEFFGINGLVGAPSKAAS